MSQGFGPFGAEAPDMGNPFSNVEIPQVPPNGFIQPPQTPNGAVQTQNSGFSMNANPPMAPMPEQPNNVFNQTNAFGFQNHTPQPAPMPTNQQFMNGNVQNNNPKYNIIDLFWLINPKMNAPGNDSQMMIISYNADFNSLGLRFTGINNMSQTSICVKDLTRQSSVNLFPEHCCELMHLPEGQQFNLIERVFNTANWQPNQTVFLKKDNMLIVQSIDVNNHSYGYTFAGWQYAALYKALEYALNGLTWHQHMMIRHSSR